MNSNQTYIKTFSRDIKPSASVNTNISIPIENSKTKNGQVDGATLADDETRTESFRSLKSRFENLTLQQSQASGSTFVLGGGVNVNGIQKANKPQPQHKQQLQNESVSELRQDESLKINDQRNSPKPPVNLTASNALKPPKPALPQRSPSKPISRSTSSYITNSATDLRKLEDHHDPFDDSQGIDPFADDNDLVDEPLPIETPSSNVRVPRAKPHTPPECSSRNDKNDDDDVQHHTRATQRKSLTSVAGKGNKPPLPDRPQMPPPPLPNRPSSLRSQTGTTISGEEGKSRKR
ncbi:1425_t:CDS:2, partial [Acaulospora morrowiae]